LDYLKYTDEYVDIIATSRKLEDLSDPAKAEFLPRFFKDPAGRLRRGGCFRGRFRSQCCAVARKYQDLPTAQMKHLLRSGSMNTGYCTIDPCGKFTTAMQQEEKNSPLLSGQSEIYK